LWELITKGFSKGGDVGQNERDRVLCLLLQQSGGVEKRGRESGGSGVVLSVQKIRQKKGTDQ